MHVTARLALALALVTAAARPAAAQQIPLAQRARAISQAVVARRAELADTAWVEACGVWRGLDRSPRYLEMLDTLARAQVRGDTARCTERPPGAHALWILTGVRRGAPGVILVTATYLVPFSRERTETYVVTRRGDGEWGVTEIRLGRSIEKVGQPLIPGPARPEE